MGHEGRLWWFERMNCAVRTAHVKRPTWWGGGKTCSCAWQCRQAEARRWPPSGEVHSTPRRSAFGQQIESLLSNVGGSGRGGLGGRRRRRRWRRARPGDALAEVDGNGRQGRGGGFGALGGGGLGSLGWTGQAGFCHTARAGRAGTGNALSAIDGQTARDGGSAGGCHTKFLRGVLDAAVGLRGLTYEGRWQRSRRIEDRDTVTRRFLFTV